MKGFTLVEVILVLAILMLLALLTIPLGIRFYKSQELNFVTDELVQTLRRAQLQAMSQANYSFGVYIQPGQYILFRGDSYMTNDDEEVFVVSNDISFGGLNEVVFSKLDGIPSSEGTITLTNDAGEKSININSLGRVSYEETVVPQNCWGIDGFCDSGCMYTDYGTERNYYDDPGCSDSCVSSGIFYINPSGTCVDAVSPCYKMEGLVNKDLQCIQGITCESECEGACTECFTLPWWECNRQAGCQLEGGSPPRCGGTCDSCDSFFDEIGCNDQDGCSWSDIRWFWNLDMNINGYTSYTNCTWYE